MFCSLHEGIHVGILTRRLDLAELVPDLVYHFDLDQMRPARREYFLGNWRSREADLLFEIPYHWNDQKESTLICLLLEHQTRSDWRTPLITLIYAELYWEWLFREWESLPAPRPPFRPCPILPVVLYTGNRPWGSAMTLRDLLVEPEAFRAFLPNWKPLFWELARQPTQHVSNSQDAFLQVMTLLPVEEQDYAEAERVLRQTIAQLGSIRSIAKREFHLDRIGYFGYAVVTSSRFRAGLHLRRDMDGPP